MRLSEKAFQKAFQEWLEITLKIQEFMTKGQHGSGQLEDLRQARDRMANAGQNYYNRWRQGVSQKP